MDQVDRFIEGNEQLVAALFGRIDASEEALVARVREIAEIPSPTCEEARRTDYLLAAFPEAGLKGVHSLELGSVLGFTRSREDAIDLLLAAHIDTVFPMDTDVSARIEGNALCGPGTGDDAANVAAIVALAGLFGELGIEPAGNLAFCGTVREEGLGNLGGMAEVLTEVGARVKQAIAVDGVSPGITYRSQAIRRYAVTLKGPGGHAWNHFGTPSAVHEMARIVSALSTFEVPANPKTTFNVGRIQGGRSINAIAQECSIEVDLRSLDQETLEELERKFLSMVAEIPRDGIEVETRLIGGRPGALLDPDHDLLKIAAAAARRVGIEPVLNAASTDAALPLSRGIPAISFGTYRGGGTHTLEEYVELDSLTTGLKWLALTVLALAGVQK